MRPLRLEMKGFSAFAERTVIDFDDVELTAFVGPTGAGKSSVIDAMTFALYGSVARYGQRDVAPVINQLCNEAQLRFDFEVSGTAYTAVRVVRRTKTGGTTKEARLEAGGEVLAGDEKALSAKVVELLGLDFAKFNKTVVLPQGRFAEFLHDKPADRQALLRELLGLGVYERIGREARSRAGLAAAKADALEQHLGDADDLSDERLAELLMTVDRLETAQAQVDEAAGRIEALTASIAERGRQADEVRLRIDRLGRVAVPKGVEQLAEDRAAATESVATCRAAADEARVRRVAAIAAADAGPSEVTMRLVLGRYERLAGLTAEAAELAQRLDAAVTRSEVAVAAADGARSRQEAARVEVASRRAELAVALKSAEQAGDRAEASALLADHDRSVALRINISDVHAAVAGAEHEYHERRTACDDASAALASAERRAPAAALAAHLRPGEPCPVCEQIVHTLPSGHGEPAAVIDAARATAAEAQAALDRADATLRDLRHSASAAEIELADCAARLAGRPDRETTLALLSRLDELAAAVDAARRALDDAQLAATALDDPATGAVFAEEQNAAIALGQLRALRGKAQDDLAVLEAELVDSPSRTDALAQLEEATRLAVARNAADDVERRAVADVHDAEVRLDAVTAREQAARHEFDEIRESVAELRPPRPSPSLAASWAALAAWATATAAALADECASLERAGRAESVERDRILADVTSTVGLDDPAPVDIASVRRALTDRLVAARGDVEHLRRERERVERARADIALLRADAAVGRQLGELLRTTGFERWLLEEALDDLVARANTRLKELSSGQYSLVAADSTFRIIDHRNADEQRDARSLSGGETFLASLALALALADSSMELASEGTAPLESIFLDEGFGTLDADTLDVVAATIEELGASGRMVGIITHIRDLAERMPTRFEVTKGPRSSVVQRVDT